MAEPAAAKLYSPRLLALSAALAEYPFDDQLDAVAEARSRTCGSTITFGISTAEDGAISRVGMRVSACAVGQSSAALLAKNVIGRSAQDIERTHSQILAWLSGEGALPDWPDFDALEPALPHTGRHEAILLPWRAALEALSTEETSG